MERVNSREFVQWMAHYELEPWDIPVEYREKRVKSQEPGKQQTVGEMKAVFDVLEHRGYKVQRI